ncbi:hypothetical protein Bbelb_408340 [Branchiostoma belcheri]|nr:hypothetical protein Bbelb_408340 [Branchiostoma belcheri]
MHNAFASVCGTFCCTIGQLHIHADQAVDSAIEETIRQRLKDEKKTVTLKVLFHACRPPTMGTSAPAPCSLWFSPKHTDQLQEFALTGPLIRERRNKSAALGAPGADKWRCRRRGGGGRRPGTPRTNQRSGPGRDTVAWIPDCSQGLNQTAPRV